MLTPDVIGLHLIAPLKNVPCVMLLPNVLPKSGPCVHAAGRGRLGGPCVDSSAEVRMNKAQPNVFALQVCRFLQSSVCLRMGDNSVGYLRRLSVCAKFSMWASTTRAPFNCRSPDLSWSKLLLVIITVVIIPPISLQSYLSQMKHINNRNAESLECAHGGMTLATVPVTDTLATVPATDAFATQCIKSLRHICK